MPWKRRRRRKLSASVALALRKPHRIGWIQDSGGGLFAVSLFLPLPSAGLPFPPPSLLSKQPSLSSSSPIIVLGTQEPGQPISPQPTKNSLPLRERGNGWHEPSQGRSAGRRMRRRKGAFWQLAGRLDVLSLINGKTQNAMLFWEV